MDKNNQKLYIISGVFAVALLVLYILHFTASRPTSRDAHWANFSTMQSDTTVTLPIAFVHVDSLLMNYYLAQEMNEKILRKEEGIRATLTQRMRNINNAIAEFERRIQTNAFLTEERARTEAQRIQRMQEEAQQLEERLVGEFNMEQMRLTMQLEDTIRARMAEFNDIRGFEIIFSNRGTGTILHAQEKYNITQEVTHFLNSRHVPITENE